jgi:hypothetical protein
MKYSYVMIITFLKLEFGVNPMVAAGFSLRLLNKKRGHEARGYQNLYDRSVFTAPNTGNVDKSGQP